jgi:hypothetical protein
MDWHRADVIRNNDETMFLSPTQQLRIGNAQMKFGLIADASDLEREGTTCIGSMEGCPQGPAEIFIEHIAQGHESASLSARGLDRFIPLVSFSELGDARRVRTVGAKLIQLGLVLRHILIDLASIFQVERDDLVDQGQFQGGKLTVEHLGRVALIVIENEVIEADPVPHQTDFTVRMPVQIGRQEPEQDFGPVHH